MTETVNRVSENGEQTTKEPISMEDAAKHAQMVLDSHKQHRLQMVQKELDELMKKYNVSLEARQMIVNGQLQPLQIAIVLNPQQ